MKLLKDKNSWTSGRPKQLHKWQANKRQFRTYFNFPFKNYLHACSFMYSSCPQDCNLLIFLLNITDPLTELVRLIKSASSPEPVLCMRKIVYVINELWKHLRKWHINIDIIIQYATQREEKLCTLRPWGESSTSSDTLSLSYILGDMSGSR